MLDFILDYKKIIIYLLFFIFFLLFIIYFLFKNKILDRKICFFIFISLILIILIFKDKIFKDKIFNKIFNKNNINLFKRKKEVIFNEERNKTLEIPKKFIESNTFQGKKENYVFKNDSLGIGYYLDE